MSDFFFSVGVLLRKELLMILKDKRSRIILVMPILIQTILFGYVATYDLNCVEYALLDEDHSHTSRELISFFNGVGIYKCVAILANSTQIQDIVDSKKALMVLHISQGFEEALQRGQNAGVQVILDGRNSNVAGTASGYATEIIERFNASRLPNRYIPYTYRAWFNPNLETRWGILSALIAILAVIQVLSIAGQSVAREKEQGTFDQLLVTPFEPAVILLGKAIGPVLVGLVQSTIVLLATLFVFKIPFAGSYFLLYGALVFFNFAVVGIGLCVSAYSKNMQQAMLYNFTLIMPMILLSGFATPIASMPTFFQWLTLLNPVRYGVAFSQRIYLEGATFTQIFDQLWPLVIIAAITLSAAMRLFRKY